MQRNQGSLEHLQLINLKSKIARVAPYGEQRGAILIFLVFIVGLLVTVFSLGALSPVNARAAKDAQTAKALMEAKSALIGWAAANADAPGRLPCPEDTSEIGTENEGEAAGYCALPAIGRLPFKTLGLGDLRDGNEDRLWYVISNGFRDTPINSEASSAQLAVDGIANSAVAIIFSPGTPLDGQQRTLPTAANPPNVSDYLDLNNSDGDSSFISSSSSPSFNDRLLAISHQELFGPVEKRVLRDVKYCLDTYASNSNGKYPWASPVTSPTHAGVQNTTFGRIPLAINRTGTWKLGPINLNIDDPNMQTTWNASCTFSDSSGYWYNNDWENLVFYQLASGYGPKPFNTGACNSTCLQVTGSGNPYSGSGTYRATAVLAGRALATQTRSDTSNTAQYLEGSNIHVEPTPTTTFETYRITDSQHATVNDLVLCIDGNNNCK